MTRLDAAEMIKEIKGYAMLTGFRGQPPVDLDALENLLVKVSHFIDKNPDVIELDLNPCIVTDKGVLAVDARMVVKAD